MIELISEFDCEAKRLQYCAYVFILRYANEFYISGNFVWIVPPQHISWRF